MCSISQIHLNDEQDKVGWVFGSKNSFFVKSIYNNLTSNESGLHHKKIWKGKILAKIKIFLWLILNDSILTKDNMLKRNRHGDPTCCFCRTDESALHLECNVAKTIWVILAKSIGVDDIPRSLSHAWSWPEKWLPNGQKFHTLRIAAICWAIWKTRNKAWFEGTILHNPVTIVSHTCALIKYWTDKVLGRLISGGREGDGGSWSQYNAGDHQKACEEDKGEPEGAGRWEQHSSRLKIAPGPLPAFSAKLYVSLS